MLEIIGKATRIFPHRKVTLPHRAEPSARLSVFLDFELGYVLDVYEPAVTAALSRELCDESVFFDIGAHIGTYSVLGGLRAAEVHSFEPNGDNFERLRENTRLNPIEATLSNTALWDWAGSGSLSGNGPETMSISPDPHGDVELITLDKYVDEHATGVDLMKIDVEGGLSHVIGGGQKTILDEKPTILAEIHTQEELREVETLVGSGYRQETVDSRHVLLRPD